MKDASSELRQTLDNLQIKKDGISAVTHMQKNIEGFNINAHNLQKTMDRFDGSVEHTFESIDKELGDAVEKLSTFGRIISEQNQLILENMLRLKEQEKKEK